MGDVVVLWKCPVGPLLCLFEPPGTTVDDEQIGAVDESFDDGAGASGVGKDGAPVSRLEVGREDDASPRFVSYPSADRPCRLPCVAGTLEGSLDGPATLNRSS